MSLVLDASLTLSWFFPDERTSEGVEVLALITEQGALVPSLWRLEVANSLQVGLRRKRLDTVFRDRALSDLAKLPIAVDTETDTQAWKATLALAERFQLTLYDAAYLELAERRALPLASLDQKLREAAMARDVGLLGQAP
jgi:predicted nucleic acid-binding protein